MFWAKGNPGLGGDDASRWTGKAKARKNRSQPEYRFDRREVLTDTHTRSYAERNIGELLVGRPIEPAFGVESIGIGEPAWIAMKPIGTQPDLGLFGNREARERCVPAREASDAPQRRIEPEGLLNNR